MIRALIFLILTFSFHQSFANPSNYSALGKAKYLLLIDQDTNEVLLEKNADAIIYPSSMTKLMTAYVVFKQLQAGKISLNDKCLIGSDAQNKIGSKMLLEKKDVVTIDQLISGLIIVSGNDAAVALAQAVSGSVADFAALMNKNAKEIGLKNSQFKNPHGLNQDGHYMSLRDLAILSKRIKEEFPEYSHYFAEEEMVFNDNIRKNHNPLIQNKYPGATGMKTGMTSKGGYGMVGTAQRGKKRLIAITNNADSASQREEIITAMLDYGFEGYTKVNILNKGERVTKAKTWLGKKEDVDLVIAENVEINIPNFYPTDEINLEVKYQEPIYTPIAQGQPVANLVIKIADKKIREVPLLAQENIDKADLLHRIYHSTRYKIYQFLKNLK